MLLDENLFKEEKVSNHNTTNKGWTHFTYKSGANPYVAKTSLEKNRILKKYRNSTRKTGDSSYEIDDTKKNKDLFSVNEDASAKAYGKKLGSENIQYYSLMNRFNYTIKQVRIDNNNKTYEIGSFKIPHRTSSTHNGAEFKRFIDSLKEKGYTEVKNSKNDLSENAKGGNRVAYSIVVFSDKNKPGETILTATPKNAFDYLYFDTAEQAQEYADKNYPDAEYVAIREDSWFDSRGYARASGPYSERTNGNWSKHPNKIVGENLTEGQTRFSEIDTDLSQEIFNVVLPKKVIADDLVSFMYQFNDGLKAGMNKMELLVALKDARTPDEFGRYIYNNSDPDKYRKIYNESKKLKESFNSNPRTLSQLKDAQAYDNMIEVAGMLTSTSYNNWAYEVEDCYLDYGQKWMWTTIICYNDKGESHQVLNPAEWVQICNAESEEKLKQIVDEIKSDEYFQDRDRSKNESFDDLEKEFTVRFNKKGFEYGGYGAVRVKASNEEEAKKKFLDKEADKDIEVTSVRPTRNEDIKKGIRLLEDNEIVKESFDDLDDWSRMPYAVYMVDSDDKIVGESLTRQEAKRLTEDLKNTFQDYIYVTRVEYYERHGRQEKDYQDVVDVYKKDGKLIVNLDRFHIFNINDSLKLDESNVIGGEVEYIETYNGCKIYKLSSGEFSASVPNTKLGSRNVDGESIEEVRRKIDEADKAYRKHFYDLPEALDESFEDEHGVESVSEEQPQVEIPAQDPNNQDNGLVALVNSLIQDEFDAIQQYKDAITNFAANNKTELTTVLQDILDEENIHVGQLQSLLNSLDVSSLNIETGKQEGQEQIDLATNTTSNVVTEDLDSETPMPPEFATYKGDNVDTSQHCIRFNTYDDMVKFIESFGYEISAEDKKAHNNNWFYANKDGKKYYVTFGIYKYPEEKRAMWGLSQETKKPETPHFND